ncbi:hypothetical protein MRX96_001456 [Rhipicephalus microplus]
MRLQQRSPCRQCATKGSTMRCSRKTPVIYRKDFLSNVVLAVKEEEPLALDVRYMARTEAERQINGSFTVDVSTENTSGASAIPDSRLSTPGN